MSTITTQDGTDLYFKDWGLGQPIVFSHGWPLSGDAWEDQMIFLAARGYRCIAHDRRGHGRSGQPWGGDEVTRFLGRHRTARAAKAVLIAAVTPLMLKTASHPNGLSIEVFDALRTSVLADRSQCFRDL